MHFKSRLRVALACAVFAIAALGATLSLAQTGGSASDTPFGEPTAAVPNPGKNYTNVRGDRASNWTEQTRAEVVARHGIVATSQSVAAQAGLQMLKDGGTAADAAVATAAMLGLTEPESHGIGGDMFAIYYSAKDQKLHGINGSGWAPASWTPAYFKNLGYDATTGMPQSGVNSTTVPGAVDGWYRLQQRFGNLSFADALEPSVKLAEQGFGVSERIHTDWESGVSKLSRDPDSTHTFLRDGKAPALYSIFKNPELARAYRELQDQGPDVFYKGDIGRAIVDKVKRSGGAMTMADLRQFKSEWIDPITTSYHGYDVYQMPPNGQGFATLEILNIVEACAPKLGWDMKALGPNSPQFWHLLIEAKKLAFDDLNTYNADPRFADTQVDRLISKEYAATLCDKIDPAHAREPAVKLSHEGGTIYLTAADRWGNMVSFISSVYSGFGSGVTVPGYGFPLQNRGGLFSLDTAHRNVVAPRKRPFHTIIPAFVMKDGKPVLSFGNMGGSEQPVAQSTELVFMIDLGLNVQAAGDAARYAHDQDDNELQLESNLFDTVGAQLAAMGHNVEPSSGSPMGGYQAIHFQPDPNEQAPKGKNIKGDPAVNGVYRGGTDFRKDGSAVGW
jgi:gamma-glutamyltranspeptidase/glutathione hydrolase